ncbi:hypothetical protein LVD13_00700 [Flavobacteriaceae bacterium D16]|nr:hypothetical protein [Flavobacteriaceae bacterium D16]
MKLKMFLTLTALCLTQLLSGQIKIGDNPQNLDAGSVLELESSNRALVITRLTTVEMDNLTPLAGALIYNIDTECIYYYDGSVWINLCETSAFELTNDAIVNPDTTIVLTPVGNQINIEVDEITGLNIADGTITREDYQLGSVGGNIIQNQSITPIKIQAGLPNQFLRTNAAGTDAVWANPNILGMGKANGGIAIRAQGASITPLGTGTYNVSLNTPRPSADYIIQLTVFGDNRIYVASQLNDSFLVEIVNPSGLPADAVWYFTIFDF